MTDCARSIIWIVVLTAGVFSGGCGRDEPRAVITVGMSGQEACGVMRAAGGRVVEMDMAPPPSQSLQCFDLADGRVACLVFGVRQVSSPPGGTDSSVLVVERITVCTNAHAPKAFREWKQVGTLELPKRPTTRPAAECGTAAPGGVDPGL